MSRFSLQARWVLPIDRPPIAGGVVSLAEGRIESIGSSPIADAPVQDLGDVALMPGMVNAHTHLEFSQLDKPLGKPGIQLPDWIQLVIASRQQAKRNPNDAVMAGLRESSRHGVTTLGEIATRPFFNEAAEAAPSLVSFQEVIGFSIARIDSVLTEVEHRLRLSDPTNIALSPHAPYTVHPQLLERLVDLACCQQLPIAMHLAESSAEIEFLATASGPFRDLLEQRSMWDDRAIPLGTKPLDYLQTLARAPRALVVHGNYLSPVEIQFLAAQRANMSVAYCPRTYAYFEHSDYPLQQMLAAGVQVALGTDSRASNPDLSLLGEMRYVASHYSEITPQQVLAMGTLAGAQALGMGDVVGSITPGKWADLTAIPCGAQSNEPEAALLHSNAAPTQTWLRGQPLW